MAAALSAQNGAAFEADLRTARLLIDGFAAFTAVVLAFAEEGPTPALALPAALYAAVRIDGPGRPGIPTWAAAILGLGGFVAAGFEVFTGGEDAKLLGGVHLLTYLTATLLLLTKRVPDLGRLLVLCVLQIALAALLTNSAWLGIGLMGGLTLSVWSLIVLQWLGMSQRSAMQQPGGTTTTRQLLYPSLYMAAISLVAGLLLFMVVPRIWKGQLSIFNNIPLPGSTTETGFSEEVRLGDIGTVMEDNTVQMRIRTRRVNTDDLLRFDEVTAKVGRPDPLLRGTVLSRYEDGLWKATNTPTLRVARPRKESDFAADEMYIHECELEPIGTRVLFAPAWTVSAVTVVGSRLRGCPYDTVRAEFLRPDNIALTEHLRYNLFTEARPRSLSPMAAPRPMEQGLFARAIGDLLSLDPALKAELAEYVADEIPEAAALSPGSTASERAAVISRHLNDADLFRYTLDLKVDDRTIDPVLDFLRNRRKGHCEYFASALALLLRSQGVAARVVNGFKGGDWNETDQVYEVRSLHAHAWVEVYEPARGSWEMFDPTPAARDTQVAADSLSRGGDVSFFRGLRDLWYAGIFMTQSRQKQVIYEPLSAAAVILWQTIRDYPQLLRAYWLGETLADGRRPTAGLLLYPVIVLVVLVGSVWSVRRLLRRRRRSEETADKKPHRGRPADAPDTPWYERFLKLAQLRTGQSRQPSATPREYVRHVGPADATVDEVGGVLTPLFYASRFGRKDVPAEVIAEASRRLEEAAAPPAGRGG